jgi:isochorismate hydrolase
MACLALDRRRTARVVIDMQRGFDEIDATWTFDRAGIDGERHRAADIHHMSLANLAGEFAAIVTTAEVVTAASAPATRAHRGDRIP